MSGHLYGTILVKAQKASGEAVHPSQMNISFHPLTVMDIEDYPMVICVEIRGHDIHRIYVDSGSATEILYEHCFLRLRADGEG